MTRCCFLRVWRGGGGGGGGGCGVGEGEGCGGGCDIISSCMNYCFIRDWNHTI